ncbi:TPA: hypothetical protein EYN98_34025 [Candidatus Poribacteria bacterium]|nr:hypothetical protein [Candidatus Poribacteria bacterium]HIA70979.1 hypothetical protein [Candidatus Poribacteria bacterium]HIB85643.1 hypothetical protein [Candidatus Poribacteria bacterium]HIO46635.1 hypothetical protein [Candidatus Poribacteria bacterium]
MDSYPVILLLSTKIPPSVCRRQTSPVHTSHFQTYLTLFHRISSEPKQFWLIKGIWVTQSNAQYPFLVNKEDALRAKGVQAVQKMCQIARLLNAATLYVQPGRINPRGPWLPHPENTDPATVERLVSSLRGIASAAESEGVCLVLEGHVVSPLPTPEKV